MLCLHYRTMTMPLAKVIPIVNGLVYTILADAPNPFVQVILRVLISKMSHCCILCLGQYFSDCLL